MLKNTDIHKHREVLIEEKLSLLWINCMALFAFKKSRKLLLAGDDFVVFAHNAFLIRFHLLYPLKARKFISLFPDVVRNVQSVRTVLMPGDRFRDG